MEELILSRFSQLFLFARDGATMYRYTLPPDPQPAGFTTLLIHGAYTKKSG